MFKSLLPSAAAAFALLLIPATASAHTKLIGSTPAANSTVSKVTSVDLKFNEKVIASTLKTEFVMTGMPGMANHAPMKVPYSSMMGKEGKSAMLMLKRPLTAGTYKVTWSAAGVELTSLVCALAVAGMRSRAKAAAAEGRRDLNMNTSKCVSVLLIRRISAWPSNIPE